ncbi:MAG: alkylhydroperoxidase-related (seleno)protein [Alphaproteobacteria bacterium]|nr:alkylhydroperoxidase-related (seleno)protein [Alphaproteobacteria bacterium]
MRPDIAAAHIAAWERIGAPGTWLTGKERVAIAAETRHALDCPHCAARQAALSPLAVAGAHRSLGVLAADDVEAVHRIRTDSGRIGEGWFRRVAAGAPEDRYVELVSVVVITVAVDTFRLGAGLAPLPLPASRPGEPGRHRPVGARPGPGFTHSLRPEDVTADEPDMYCQRTGAHILLALSLVPQSMVQWWDCFETMYETGPQMRDFATEYRAISHAQLEMLAARVAALNQCEY